MGGHAVLQVPVPALEPFVRERHAHYDAAWVSADPAFTHAHVTALGPWLSSPSRADLAAVAAVAAAVPAFAVTFARVEAFANGIVHLVPDPDDGFRQLTARLVAAFPACPPYDGAFEPVPHLTLDSLTHVGLDEVRDLLAEVVGPVPLTVRATRLDLAWWEAGACRLLDSWPLGVGGMSGAGVGAAPYGDAMTQQTDTGTVLARFLDAEGRLTSIPSKRAKLRVVLDHLAQSFELGRTYPEREVNELLARFHPDVAALRRYLVVEAFLTREHSVYRRSGGTVGDG